MERDVVAMIGLRKIMRCHLPFYEFFFVIAIIIIIIIFSCDGSFLRGSSILEIPNTSASSARRSTSHDAPVVGDIGSEYIKLFFSGLDIPVLLHFFILL